LHYYQLHHQRNLTDKHLLLLAQLKTKEIDDSAFVASLPAEAPKKFELLAFVAL
jgi:hypothetical protein